MYSCTMSIPATCSHLDPILLSFQISFPQIWVRCLRAHRLASKQRKRSPKTQCDGRWPCAHFLGGLFKERPGVSQESVNDNGSDVAHNAGNCVCSELYHVAWIEYEYLVLPTIPTIRQFHTHLPRHGRVDPLSWWWSCKYWCQPHVTWKMMESLGRFMVNLGKYPIHGCYGYVIVSKK